MLCRNHVKNLTLSGAPLTLCPRRYGTPQIVIVTYYLLRDYPKCAPSPDGGLVAQEGGLRVTRKGFLQSKIFQSRLEYLKKGKVIGKMLSEFVPV